MKLTRILFPTDFSETAEHALELARDLATQNDACLHLLHVVRDPVSHGWPGDAAGVMDPNLIVNWRRTAEQRLRELPLDGTHTESAVCIGHPFLEIVRYARNNQIDLIVMGTHGRGPIQHMLLGSVAEKVVRKAPCPVLTVNKPDHAFVMPAT